MSYLGSLVARERLRRNWSQKGLCRGICAVSYLSKIESGKAEPSDQILSLLLERLGLQYDSATEAQAEGIAQRGFELLLTLRLDELRALLDENDLSRLRITKSGLEIEALDAVVNGHAALDSALEPCMSPRTLALQRILQHREGEAVLLCPCAYTNLMLGIAAYERGNYTGAIEALQNAYELASREGAVRVMLESRMFIGNCYCNRQDLPNMERSYRIAGRLAEDLNDRRVKRAIGYNTASAWIEAGRYEDAYAWFSGLEEPSLMSLHKLAICCEKTGRREEGLRALDQTEAMDAEELDPELAKQLCALVRYRLEHPDYLRREEYGAMLMNCFDRCRAELASGYAVFHLPWVVEWYTAVRQYKKAFELLEKFPGK